MLKRDKNKIEFLINPLSEKAGTKDSDYLKELKKIMRDIPFQKLENELFMIDPVKITVSIGIACYPSDLALSSKAKAMLETTSEQDLVIYMADKALYFAKKNGRNRCLTYRKVQESVTDQSQNKELEQTTIKKIMEKLQHKFDPAYQHSSRVSKIAEIVAKGLNLDPADVKFVKNAALLHDIGKLLIDNALLQKPNEISQQEFMLIRSHVEKGAALIEQFPVLHKYINALNLHHELLNGSGYPMNISGDRLPIEAKIIVVADYFDTVTNFGCYLKNKNNTYYKQSYFMTKEAALEKIKENSNVLYDPKVVNVFVEKFSEIKDVC